MAKTARARTKAPPPPLPLALRYLRESRDFATGFLFIVPLLVVYEVGVVVLRSQVINWAHGLIRTVLHVFGWAEPVLFGGIIAILVVVCLARAERFRIDVELLGLMLVESIVYASVLGLLCSFITRHMLAMSAGGGGGSLLHEILLSIGAGVYEEILFRVALFGGMCWALKKWTGMRPRPAALTSIVVSSLLFSACHHIGPYGDPWQLDVLVYRFWMGVAFAAIYRYRGLGIVVYTHAIYDIIVTLSR
ncbi:lysostaphin resistance A-like protein [Planctomycetota bacterium]